MYAGVIKRAIWQYKGQKRAQEDDDPVGIDLLGGRYMDLFILYL